MAVVRLVVLLSAVLAVGCAEGSSGIDSGAGDDAGGGATDSAPGADVNKTLEVCDGMDNDGDTFVDEGDLCLDVANGSGRCWGTMGCIVESCEAGFYDIDEQYDSGCECQIEASETGDDDCATAVDLGDVEDTNTVIDLVGNLIPDGDVDWYRFRAVDSADTTCDNFHVRTLLTENPAEEYVVDVFRGGCGGEQICDSGIDMQWYTNFSAGGAGECPCGPTAGNHCDDDTSEFVISIRRKGGATLSCANYNVEVSNGKYPAP